MILFRPEHVELILSGKKTETRRIWAKQRVTIGSIQQAKLGKDMLKKDAYFAKLKILDINKERLADISIESVHREGFDSLDVFQEKWIEINGEWNPHQEVYVIRFEVVA
jgi:hypothetical protein